MRWLAVVLMIEGCAPKPYPCRADPYASNIDDPLPLGVAGLLYETEVYLPVVCDPDAVTRSAQIGVLDPDGDSVEATAELLAREAYARAKVRLTPRRGGRHRITVRFEPHLGRFETDFEVAANLLGTTPARVLDASWETCPRIDALPSGEPICLGALGARAGSVVWSSDGGSVSRWVERDGGLEHEADLQLSHPIDLLLPGETDVFALLRWYDAVRIEAAPDGGLAVAEQRYDPTPRVEPWLATRVGDALTYPSGFSSVFGVNREGIFGLHPSGALRAFTRCALDGGDCSDKLAAGQLTGPREAVIPWDTAAQLVLPNGQTVLLGWKNDAFTFTFAGDVHSATTDWVTARAGDAGQLYLLHR